MNDMHHYIREPNVSLAEREDTRLDTVGEMLERLRRLAWNKLGRPSGRPTISARVGPDGWEISIYNAYGTDRFFSGETLSECFRAATSWATRDEIAEGYLTLGLDAAGSRIVETGERA